MKLPVAERLKRNEGVPLSRPGHAKAAADMALAMPEIVRRETPDGRSLYMHIGINTGPAVGSLAKS